MKLKNKFLTAASMGIAVLLTACAAPGEEVVMSIGDYELTQSEYYEMLRDETYTEDFSYGDVILEQHILVSILEDKYGSNVKESDIQETLQSFIDGFEGEDNYKEFLEGEGLTEENIKENMRMQALINEAFKEFYPLEDAEIEEMYEDMVPAGRQVRHILVADEEEANVVLSKLDDGEDFGELMKEYSMDEASLEENDGLMPLFRGMYVPEFEEAALSLEEQENYTGAVQTDFGYHIIELANEGKKGTLEEETDSLVSQHYEQMMQMDQNAYPELMNELLREYEEDIEIHDEAMSDLIDRILKTAELQKKEREEYDAMMEQQLNDLPEDSEAIETEVEEEVEEVEEVETEEADE